MGRVKSGCGRETEATRFLAEFLDGLVKVLRKLKEKSGRGWRRLPQKVEARGGEQQLFGRRITKPFRVHLQQPRRSQLDDWPDSPEKLTKCSAATTPLPALTRTSLGSAPQVPINLGNPSTWVPESWPLQHCPLTRAFACLELPQIVKLQLPAVTEPAASPNNLPLPLTTPARPSHPTSTFPLRPDKQSYLPHTLQFVNLVRPGNCKHVS